MVEPVELDEELSPADAVLLMGSAPERISDLVFGLDEAKLRYRHGPAFPTLGGLIGHLLESGSKVDALLRRAHLEGLSTADIRSTIDPGHDQDLDRPLPEARGSGAERSTCSTAGARTNGTASSATRTEVT